MTKCDNELTAMTEDRDHWRDLAKERADQLNAAQIQIVELKLQLEAQRDDTELLNIGELLGGLRDQREKYRRSAAGKQAQIDRYVYLLRENLAASAREVLRQKDYYEHVLQEMTPVFEGRELPYISFIFESVSRAYTEAQQESTSAVAKAVVEYKGNDQYDPITNPELCFTELLRLSSAGHTWHLAGILAHYSYHYSDDQRAVAWSVIEQCKEYGEPTPESVERLGLQWIKDHLPSPPAKYDTLVTGLRIRQKEITSKKTRKEFSVEVGFVDTRLREFEGWYDAISGYAMLRPTSMFEQRG